MLSFKHNRTKRRSRSYADVPLSLVNRKLPALPIHKRKLPALPQSNTLFKDEPTDEAQVMPSKVSLEGKHSAPSAFNQYFRKRKLQKRGQQQQVVYNPSTPKSIPLAKNSSSKHQKSKSDDGRSIRDIFFNMVTNIGGSKKYPNSARNLNTKPKMNKFDQPKSKWHPSLEFINNDSELLQELIAYCTRTCCEENIEFLQVIYNLNKKITRLLLSYDVTPVQENAINIEIISVFTTFIFKTADKQLNLSHEVYDRIMEDYNIFRKCSLNQKSMMFDECTIQIERLIKKSVLHGFYASEPFQAIARSRGIMENKKYVEPAKTFEYLGGFDMMSSADEAEEDISGYLSDTSIASNYSNLTLSSYATTDATPIVDEHDKQHQFVHFDTYSHVEWNDTNKWMVSSKGMSSGLHEWKIEIVKSNDQRQEVGIVSQFDDEMQMSEHGICETAAMEARAVYGYNKLVKMDKNKKVIGSENHFYYSSYNADNSVRCNKDLTRLAVHDSKWKEGDVIRIVLNMDKGIIKFYLNDKKVRKAVSVDKHATFYPIVLFSGNCEYRLVD